MKIKGSYKGDKNTPRGKQKGDPIEYTPEEKFPLAVREAVRGQAPKGEVWWAEEVQISKKHWTSKGPRSKQKSLKTPEYANNSYAGSGTCFVRRQDLAPDKLRPRKKVKFKIDFCDCIDDIGMPDLQIDKFDFEEVRR